MKDARIRELEKEKDEQRERLEKRIGELNELVKRKILLVIG